MANKPNVEIKVTSEPHDINKTGYDEEPAKYMANPRKGFWNTICKIFNQKEAP